MEISAIDQEVNDYDWFAIDNENKIAHLASVGGVLPLSVSRSADNNFLLINYFQSLEIKKDAFLINANFQIPSNMQRPEMRKIFFHYFSLYSARGFYSFNRNELDSNGKLPYFEYSLLTLPINPLEINSLPINIQEIVSRTRYRGVFSKSNIIDLRDIT